jgi:hypothetical protein
VTQCADELRRRLGGTAPATRHEITHPGLRAPVADPDPGPMRKLLFTVIVALATSAVLPGVAPARTSSTWTSQANQVCAVWLAKAKAEFSAPVKPSGLYKFAVKAKALESQELAQLEKIPGPSAAGTRALGAMRADTAEVGSAISAWDRGDRTSFVRILKQYLNDHRTKAAFAAAGASTCG